MASAATEHGDSIARLLAEDTFTFSPAMLASIHRRLFEGILSRAGRYRQTNIKKKEWVLDGASVLYSSCDMIAATLDYDFEQERMFSYKGIDLPRVVRRISNFVSGIWQIHPFGEGNTRTTAVFTIKYLRQLGYKVDNEPFKEHSWYFRNALVRANYQNLPAGVERTTEFLELFFRNLLMGEDNELKNRYLHVRWKDDGLKVSEEGSQIMAVGTQKGTQKTVKSTQKIMEMVAADASVTTEEMAQRLGISRRAVAKHIANLKEKGLLLRIGPDKGGHWEIVSNK